MAHEGVDFHAVHAERAIPAQHDHLRVGLRHLGPQTERHSYSHAAVGAGVHAVPWSVRGNRLAGKVQDLVSVYHDDRIAVHKFAYFLAQT